MRIVYEFINNNNNVNISNTTNNTKFFFDNVMSQTTSG